MKRLKKIMALVIAMAMVLSMMSMTAFADDVSTTNNVTADKSVTISGLSAGDTVNYYQVIEWKTNTGWALTSDFEGLATSGKSGDWVIGATDEEKALRDDFAKNVLTYITGMPAGYAVNDEGTGLEKTSDEILGRINSTLAAEIAKIAKSKPATAAYTDSTISGTTSTYDDSDSATDGAQAIAPGLYLALVDAGEAGVMYNPIFVSADYSQTEITGTGDTKFHNAWAVTTTDSYSDKAIAKKSTITVSKTVTDSDTTPEQDSTKTVATADAGEILDFKIETQMPEYADNYTWAKFKVTDTLSNGLKLYGDGNLTVKVGDDTYTITADQVADSSYDTNVFNSITFADKGTSIVVDFKTSYILGRDAKKDVEITYKAVVTADALNYNVDETKNEVQVEFSNNPASDSDSGIIKDVTTQYTFSLDALINGEESSGYKTSELVKVGVDRDGNWLTESKLEEYDNGVKAYPLGGAVFGLFTSSEAATAAVGKDYDALKTADGIYTNAYYTADTNRAVARFTTDNEGKLDIKGLDAGTYYLVETKAPDGFIGDTTVKTIVITPTYKDVTVKELVNGIEITYASKVLDYYTVEVTSGSDTVTSKYTVDYGTPTWVKDDKDNDTDVAESGTAINAFTAVDSTSTASAGAWKNNHEDDAETVIQAADNTTFLKNTQGTSLPSTGGIGTTIFYTIGAILVIGAGVVLITRRRMEQ